MQNAGIPKTRSEGFLGLEFGGSGAGVEPRSE